LVWGSMMRRRCRLRSRWRHACAPSATCSSECPVSAPCSYWLSWCSSARQCATTRAAFCVEHPVALEGPHCCTHCVPEGACLLALGVGLLAAGVRLAPPGKTLSLSTTSSMPAACTT
jgi:hypothetical protein